jgi:hypothetical protein
VEKYVLTVVSPGLIYMQLIRNMFRRKIGLALAYPILVVLGFGSDLREDENQIN